MENSLSLKSNFSRGQVDYQKPHQLLSFSLNESRELVFNNSALKYFVDPPENADLNHRYEHWIKRPEERTRLDNLLRACLTNEARRERKRVNVITWRGIMTKFDFLSLSLNHYVHVKHLEGYLRPLMNIEVAGL
jgi:hypothetical protein